MCFNATSSIVAWSFANLIGVYLWKRNRRFDRWNALFIATFTLIQILEAGIWWNLPNGNTEILTALIVPALLLQPLVQNYMGWRYTRKDLLKFMTYLYLVLLIWGIGRALAFTKDFRSYKGSHGHLVWEMKGKDHILSPFTPLYLIGLFIPLFYMGGSGMVLIGIGILTFIYSWVQTKGKEFSSLWCFTAVLYALVALFI